MIEVKPTKEEFADYIRIQELGITNMLDTKMVCLMALTDLTKPKCLYIYQHYNELRQEYAL